jgi:hypothetical protein
MVRRAWLVIAGLAIAAPAVADPEIVELRYAAPAGCPARGVVEAAIRERTPNVTIGAPARRVFAITIGAVPDGFRGTLVVDDVADKELSAQRCDDLATALALVTALAIDPTATLEPRPAPPPPTRPPAWSYDADVGGLVETGVGPEVLWAGVVEGRARWHRHVQVALAAILGRDSAAQDGGTARFTWLAARPAVCRLWEVGPVTLGGCGHVEVGAVRAAGDMIVNQRDLTRLWLAAGGYATAAYPLSRSIFGQLQVGAAAPLVRDRYLFAPNVAIHETPSVTAWLGVGLGVAFW